MKTKLTRDAIRRLPAPDPSGKQTLFWDSEQRGFGLLVSGKTNAKSYVVQREFNGKTVRVTLGTLAEYEALGKSLEDARAEAAELVISMRKGVHPKAYKGPRANVTLRERAEGNDAIERWLADWLDEPLRSITPAMVEKRHREIKAAVAKSYRSRYQNHASAPGSASANKVMRALRKLWNTAQYDVPELPPNPVAILKSKRLWFPTPERERIVLGDQLPQFYKAVMKLPSRTMRDYLLLVLFTGLRRVEAASLRWADIDFSQKVIHLPATRTKAKRKLDVPMSDYIEYLLRTRREIGIENQFVFPANSKSGHLAEPKKALADLARACNVRVSMHDLRRTYATVASLCRIPPYALQALLNHSTGKGITASYARISGADLAEAQQAVTDRLRALARPALHTAAP
jgi:integrase